MRRYKKFIISWIIGIIIIFLLLFITGSQDDVYIQKYYTGVWYKDIFNYFEYFLIWVIPYWWLLIILLGSVLGIIIFLVTLLLRYIIKNIR